MKDWKFVASKLMVVLLVGLVIGLGIGYMTRTIIERRCTYSLDHPAGTPLYRSVSVLEFRECGRGLGKLTSIFSILEVSEDTVDMVLTTSFTSSDMAMFESHPSSLRSIALRISFAVDMFGEWVLLAPIPFFNAIGDYTLMSGERVVLAYRTYNLSEFDTPVVAIGYKISLMELRFSHALYDNSYSSIILLERFSEGRFKVTPQATLNMVSGFIWGIGPLFEGDYRYPPGLAMYRLEELKGRDSWRKIVIDIDYANYTVEKIEGKLG